MSVEYNCLEQLQIVQSWHDYNFDVEVQHEVSGLQPDVDIAGLGVIIAFTISAYVVLLFSIFAYFFGLLPPALLRRADRHYFYANSRRYACGWIHALEKATIAFSDQQIITGVAIMLSGYANLDPGTGEQRALSAYHWQILTYLAWMSSNVHLTTLSILRGWLRQNRVLLWCRIGGMTVLLGLMIGALVPILSINWAWAVQSRYESDRGFGVPARCFWRYAGRGGLNVDTPFSLALLIGSYIWKIGQLFDTSRYKFRKWCRSSGEWGLEMMAKSFLNKGTKTNFRNRASFRAITLIYVPFMAVCEFLESFLASLWLLSIGLVWGSIQVFHQRGQAPAPVRTSESTWGFGQLLPLLPLLQPIVAIMEHSYGKRVELIGANPEPASYELFTLNGSNIVIDRQGFVALSLNARSKTLSEILRAQQVRSPSEKAEMNSAESQIEFLYSTKFFRSLMWLIQLLVLGNVALIISTKIFWGVQRTPGQLPAHALLFRSGGIVYNIIVAGLVWSVGLMSAFVFVGSFFSRAFR